MALMRADTEDEVVELLTNSGHWDDATAWRYFGDTENNFSSIGNQQSEPVAALIEKLVNSVDARLMNACLEAGIDPEGDRAPGHIREAVSTLFEIPKGIHTSEPGRVALWPQSFQTDEANALTLSATGKGTSILSLTIADRGEGQSPDRFPDTFLSLQRSNKLRVSFVQGKFNMGGTGALQFCSEKHRLQLIVSRRNPATATPGHPRDTEWGFTVVRREAPSARMRSSVFTYLAPHGVLRGRDGNVLSFAASTMPIFPKSDSTGRDAYAMPSEYGSLVKLYEYKLSGVRSNIVSSGGGLLRRVDFGMPEMALPIRVYECRPNYKGHAGSFSTNSLGISARLERDKADRIEPGFPVPHIIRLDGKEVRVRAFALKGSAAEYRNSNHAIIFTINGQTHATRTTDFFRRKRVGLSQLKDSLLVIVDCSEIDGQIREDMFMNSRDRLRVTALSAELESELEDFLKNDQRIRELKNRRREQEIAARLEEAQPLADALSELVKSNESLSRLLGGGRRVSAPFPVGSQGSGNTGEIFEGRRFPSYFRHRKQPQLDNITREAHLGSRTRLSFETDAEDDYFHRDTEPGAIEVDLQHESHWQPLESFAFTGPSSGICHLSFELPEGVEVGDSLNIRIRVTDPSRLDAFELGCSLLVRAANQAKPGTRGKDENKNSGKSKGDSSGGLALPTITPVHREQWAQHQFDEYSAVKVVYQGENESGVDEYDFYVNYDNRYLLIELKDPKRDIEAIKAQFVYSLVLYSLGLLLDPGQPDPGALADDNGAVDSGDKERQVRVVTRAVAPFVLPTLSAMSALSE